MPTYLELKEQAEKLLQQAEELRQQETQQAIEDIKAKMKAYGLTPRDLGFTSGGRTPRAAAKGRGRGAAGSSGKAPKYRGPNGETWAGGRGRKPKWLTDALNSGKKLEDFEVR